MLPLRPVVLPLHLAPAEACPAATKDGHTFTDLDGYSQTIAEIRPFYVIYEKKRRHYRYILRMLCDLAPGRTDQDEPAHDPAVCRLLTV